MVRAILKDGMIQPLDPLPLGWGEGRELRVEEVEEFESTPAELEQWSADLNELAKDINPENSERIDKAIEEIRRNGKEEMRRQIDESSNETPSPSEIDEWYQELEALPPPLDDPKEIEEFLALVAEVRCRDRDLCNQARS